MATITDIARTAGVSKSTVSLVINGNGYVSEETKKKVDMAIEELNYVPNALARNLSLKKSNMIGIMVPDIANPFFSEFIKYGEDELYRNGYKTMICNTMESTHREEDYLNMLNRHFMDGLIISQFTLPASKYTANKLPMVSIDRTIGDNIPIVRSNHEKSAVIIAEKMIASKCKNIALFSGNNIEDTPSQRRQMILTAILESNNCNVHQVSTETPYSVDELVFSLFEDEKIDGAVGADLYIMACLREAYRRKLIIPDDFCAIAFDGTFLVDANMIPITSIRQPIKEMAEKAIEVLLNQINGNYNFEKEYVLDVFLTEGNTTKYTNFEG